MTPPSSGASLRSVTSNERVFESTENGEIVEGEQSCGVSAVSPELFESVWSKQQSPMSPSHHLDR